MNKPRKGDTQVPLPCLKKRAAKTSKAAFSQTRGSSIIMAGDLIKLPIAAKHGHGLHSRLRPGPVDTRYCKCIRQGAKVISSCLTRPFSSQLKLSGGLSVLSTKQQGKKLELKQRSGGTVWAHQEEGTGGPVGSVSTIENLKRAVISAVSNTNRGKDTDYQQRQGILKLVEELEKVNPTADPVDSPLLSGRWALLYTAPVDEKIADKYAGTEEGPFLARVKPIAFGSVRQIRSTQILDTIAGTAENIADFSVFGRSGSLIIKGSVKKAASMLEGARRVDVTFEAFSLKFGDWTLSPISLSWVSPMGWIDTTFLDKDMRVGRGDKGSVFIAVRMKQIQ